MSEVEAPGVKSGEEAAREVIRVWRDFGAASPRLYRALEVLERVLAQRGQRLGFSMEGFPVGGEGK